MGLTRRSATVGLLGWGAAGLAPRRSQAAGAWPSEVSLGPAHPFSFERLQADAAALAGRPYRAPPIAPADRVDALDYRPAASLWNSAHNDQSVRFFPLERYARSPVAMNVVMGGQAREVAYSEALFNIPAGSPKRRPGAGGGFGGFGGFRVMNADHVTDWLAFLGASYFRSADPSNQFGLSARGVAINTATADPEEFPAFTAFWLERDPAGLVVYALLDGPSVAGAYRIANHRSTAGLVQDVQVSLTFRQPVKRLGLAPLTSMYWYGRSDRRPSDDWRPQIHDSDGLSIWTGAGERIWRPLNNPVRVSVNAFVDRNPRGFGLMQRDRNFEDYQDDGILYERRPSAWIEPVGEWGPGSVQLVELPTNGENDDNIVAFWAPASAPRAGQSLNYRYRLNWTSEEPGLFGVARAGATRVGRAGAASPPGRRKYVIDFAGETLAGLDRNSGVTAAVEVRPGVAQAVFAYPIVSQKIWRLMFDVDTPPGVTVDMRAYLRQGARALSETWVDQAIG
ncbi:MAG TPA: glucan biosynthesis protein [Caulobacteraceae bacterium]|jgi:glucans biosynthesis protein|nr:glucan biosynthesis protein [Caulobacteraceae bacterium]